jgi:hypothetical protein
MKKFTLHLSAHIEKHKSAYYDFLSRMREANDLGQWVRLVLTALRDTALKGKETFEAILTIRSEAKCLHSYTSC